MVSRGKYTVNAGSKRHTHKRRVLNGGGGNKPESPYATIKWTVKKKDVEKLKNQSRIAGNNWAMVKNLQPPKNKPEREQVSGEVKYASLASLNTPEQQKNLQNKIAEFQKLSPDEQYRQEFAKNFAGGRTRGHVYRTEVPSHMFNPNQGINDWGTVNYNNMRQIQNEGQRKIAKATKMSFARLPQTPQKGTRYYLQKIGSKMRSGLETAKKTIRRKYENLKTSLGSKFTRKKPVNTHELTSNTEAYNVLVGGTFKNENESTPKPIPPPVPPPRGLPPVPPQRGLPRGPPQDPPRGPPLVPSRASKPTPQRPPKPASSYLKRLMYLPQPQENPMVVPQETSTDPDSNFINTSEEELQNFLSSQPPVKSNRLTGSVPKPPSEAPPPRNTYSTRTTLGGASRMVVPL